MTTLALEMPRTQTRPARRGPWLWNLALPEWVPIVCRVAWLRRGATVPAAGSWVWVLGPLYVSDRRVWDRLFKDLDW